MVADDARYLEIETAARRNTGKVKTEEKDRREAAVLEEMALRRQLKDLTTRRGGIPGWPDRDETEMEGTMGRMKCSVEGCENKAYVKGICVAHHIQQFGENPRKKCAVEGCERVVFKEGRCNRHHKDPLVPPLPPGSNGRSLPPQSRPATEPAEKISRAAIGRVKASKPPATPVVMDFAAFPELRDRLIETARSEYRTPEMQGYYLISLALGMESETHG